MKKFNIVKCKKTAVLVVIIFISIITIALSYAFFASFIGGPANTSVGIDSEASEKLIFNKGEDINIYATQENFAEGDGSLSGTTTSNATLIANKSKGEASKVYNIYFDISKNDFVYTIDSNTPELLLKIVDPAGNEITSITGFTYKTVIDASTGETLTGFDITTFSGLFKVREDEPITTTSYTDGTTEEWSATITFVNLSTNQHLNEAKTLDADFILTEDKMVPNEMISGPTFNSLMETSGFRDTVTQIVFDKEIDAGYETATNKWDLSVAGNEEIVGYIENVGEEQILHIQSNRRIMANLNQVGTFQNFNAITKLEFNDWYNTINATNMAHMFDMRCKGYSVGLEGCSYLTTLDLSSFITSNVTNMYYMFRSLELLTYLDLSSFDTSKVTNMLYMFTNMESVIEIQLNSFDTSNVTNMSSMFGFNTSLINLDITNFDTSKVTDMSDMFIYDSSLTSVDLSNFNTSKVNDMSSMFNGMTALTSLDITNFDTSKVTNMSKMFERSSSIKNLNLINFDTSNVIDMSNMFNGMDSLVNLEISSFDTSSVMDMSRMFSYSDSITSLDLTNFDTSKVTDMSTMFSWTTSLTTLNLSNFNTSNVTSMSYMFSYSNLLTSLDLRNFNTSKVTNMSNMFKDMHSLTSIDLSSFDMSNVTNSEDMFRYSKKITEAYAKTQADADILNATSNKPTTFTFVATE